MLLRKIREIMSAKEDLNCALARIEKLQKEMSTKEERYKATIEELQNEINSLNTSNKNADAYIKKIVSENNKLNVELSIKVKNCNELIGRTGGLTRWNKKLKLENKELKDKNKSLTKQLEHSVVVTKVPSGRPANPQKSKIRITACNKPVVRNYMNREGKSKK